MTVRITARRAVAAAVALVVLSAAGGALAGGGTFTDVPPSNQFYDEIEAIAGAGITTGFPGGTYRPNQNVSRGAMAAFMGRGFSRTGFGSGSGDVSSPSLGPPVGIPIASVTVDAGAAGGGNGYVALSGSITIGAETITGCACRIDAYIVRLPDLATGPGSTTVLGTFAVGGATTLPVSWALPIAADTSTQYVLVVQITSSLGAQTLGASGQLIGTYVPFAASAGSAPTAPPVSATAERADDGTFTISTGGLGLGG